MSTRITGSVISTPDRGQHSSSGGADMAASPFALISAWTGQRPAHGFEVRAGVCHRCRWRKLELINACGLPIAKAWGQMVELLMVRRSTASNFHVGVRLIRHCPTYLFATATYSAVVPVHRCRQRLPPAQPGRQAVVGARWRAQSPTAPAFASHLRPHGVNTICIPAIMRLQSRAS